MLKGLRFLFPSEGKKKLTVDFNRPVQVHDVIHPIVMIPDLICAQLSVSN